ncbi:MAG: methane monooxygenase [Deltaproteobacteria bacterium]|nr:methane monooxygenase [Deltaproteobacteria bacterium]
MARNLIKAHDKVKGLEWTPTYFEPEAKYPTKFHIPKKAKDPFRHLIRDYMAMEAEKDNRQYGFLDGAVRMDNPNQVTTRFAEGMKPAMAILPFAEYAAGKCQGQLISAVDNEELRNGYLAQMLDEVRHVQQEMYLGRYYMKHYHDPAGFDIGQKAFGNHFLASAGRSFFETFIAGDPIECSISLQVVGETAFTNPLFVAFPNTAAANGDHATPTVFLSIQSDEARHMANGYATLVTVLSDDRNLPLIQEALDKYFWRGHVFIDAFLGTLTDYFSVNRVGAYKNMWKQWVLDDWVGSFIARLEKFGLQPPRWLPNAQENIQWLNHSTAMAAYAMWPIAFWRYDAPSEREQEWFETQYPGWNSHYGKFWEAYRQMTDPRNGQIPAQLFPSLPPLCQVCQMPCVFPRPDASTMRIKEKVGKKRAFCSEPCEWIFDLEPQRYVNYTNWYEKFDGWDLADVITHLGYLRPDGKTLIAQPHLSHDDMWTIDDIRRLKFEIKDPLRQ